MSVTTELNAAPMQSENTPAPAKADGLDEELAMAAKPTPETPSGKGADDENFPVGSFLLPKKLRAHVAVFYNFARAMDDIADNGDLPLDERIKRLKAFDAALTGAPGFDKGYEKAHALRASLRDTNVTTQHGSDLIAAFVQDCEKLRYDTWEELLGYCRLSANPVGRYLLDLHGEDKAGYPYSDALCTVLQIVNHLQDCADDKRELDRIYIIRDWLKREGGDVDLIDGPSTAPALRRVFDEMLDGCEALMVDARRLPAVLKSRRLAMESEVIVRLADRLIKLLRAGDPLASRVALKKPDFAWAGVSGAVAGYFAAGRLDPHAISPVSMNGAGGDGDYSVAANNHARNVVKASGTSFASGMRILPKPRREAMYAIYAFCREVDDIADEGGTVEEKKRGLNDWRAEIDRLYEGCPQTATGKALLTPVRNFDLPKEEFILMIEGMEMDANGPVVAPSMETLYAYTRRVAGSVGMLSMPAFGAPKGELADRFALSLADALQLTNILRDVGEDAQIDRLYLPRELLEKYDAGLTPGEIINSRGLPQVAEELGAIAEDKFAQARAALKDLDWRVLRPALLMMGVYEAYLKKLKERGWDKVGAPIQMSKWEKLAIALRYAVAPPLDEAP